MEDTPLSAEEAAIQASELIDRNRFDHARALLGKSFTQYPDDIELLACAMRLEWLEDCLDESKEIIGKLLELDPQHYGARYVLANIFMEEEDYSASEKELISLLQDYPEDAVLYAIYARVMLLTFNFEKAEKLAHEALRREPESEGALQVATLSSFVNEPKAATADRVGALIERYPDQYGTAVLLVQTLIDRGREREAYQLTCELIRSNPNDEHLVELANALKLSTHWSMRPLWPMQRFGWAGSIAIWGVIVVLLRGNVLDSLNLAQLQVPIAMVFVVYVIYSWVWPPILGKILK